eukprot:gene1969-33382_t
MHRFAPDDVLSPVGAPGKPGPLFGGEMINETDAAYAPKLYHFMIAIPHFMNYSVDAVKYPVLGEFSTVTFISNLNLDPTPTFALPFNPNYSFDTVKYPAFSKFFTLTFIFNLYLNPTPTLALP